MSSFDENRAIQLIALAVKRFGGDLLPNEVKVIHTSVSDEPLLQEISQHQQPVRPEFLRWLASDNDAAGFIDAKGIRVSSATIEGQLDLSFCRVASMLVFRFCRFQDELLLLHSELRGLALNACHTSKGVVAHGAVLHGPLFLQEGFESSSSVDFHSALIEASVQCGGYLHPTDSYSLSLESATVKGDIFLTSEFRSCGEVRLLGATIGGDFNCSGANLGAHED